VSSLEPGHHQIACAVALSASLCLAPACRAAGVTPQQVEQAVKAVAADPDLGGTRMERSLRLIPERDDTRPKKKPDAPDLSWLVNAIRWIADSGRWLVFLAGAIAVALIVVYARRWIKAQAEAGGRLAEPAPTHVRDLDIRPDSLPADIAAAARGLWLAGEQRAALSLLYRGALSRLVHAYEVPIRAASTEGECLRLASLRLPPQAAAFFGRLVAAWLLAVYGARMPDSEQVLALCGDYERHWPAGSA